MKKLLYYCLAIIARPNSDFIYTVNKLGLYGCNKMRANTDKNIYIKHLNNIHSYYTARVDYLGE